MTSSNNKKKIPIILLLLVFAVIAVVMLVVNYSSMLEQELIGPKDGVEKLSTCGNQLIVWEQTIANCLGFNNVIFSPNGQTVYASEPWRYVYAFETSAGKFVKRFVMDEYETPPNNPVNHFVHCGKSRWSFAGSGD